MSIGGIRFDLVFEDLMEALHSMTRSLERIADALEEEEEDGNSQV